MTKEEFDQLGRAYGLFTYRDSNFENQETC